MPYYRAAFGDIETLEVGRGEDVALLLHAGLSSPKSLARLAEAIAAAGWRVVAPFRAGYGGTGPAHTDDCLAGNISVVEHLLTLHQGRRTLLFGHSFGGVVGWHVAARCGAMRLPLDALVLYEPVIFQTLAGGSAAAQAAAAWDRGIAERVLADIAADRSQAGVATFVETWNEVPWETVPERARAGLMAGAPVLAREIAAVQDPSRAPPPLDGIATRVLLLEGERSPPAVHLIADCLADLATADRKRLPGIGHMGPVLAPAAVADAIIGFMHEGQRATPGPLISP